MRTQELRLLVSGQSAPQTLRVFVADDNSYTSDSIIPLLEMVVGEVVVAYEGFAVVPVAERFGHEVCVLDVRMPGVSGWEIARRLRARLGGRRLLLVAVDEVQDRETAGHSAEAGSDQRRLLKPVDRKEMCQVLADFIERSLHSPTICR